jgi:hypothetical protein
MVIQDNKSEEAIIAILVEQGKVLKELKQKLDNIEKILNDNENIHSNPG